MDVRKLDDRLAVSPQIALDDVQTIAGLGYRTLVCNRPDGEDAGQPEFEQIAAAARAAGMETVFLPVTSATMGIDPARQFADILAAGEGPVFAYCRTGTRCTMLWTISGVLAGTPKEELREAAARNGYDMTNLLESLPG